MQTLFDLIPVIVFFAGYYGARDQPEIAGAAANGLLDAFALATPLPATQVPILFATGLAMLATIGQVLWLLARGRKVDKLLWISLVIIVSMGAATLFFHDPTIIKWRPTVIDWIFAVTLLVSEAVLGKNLLHAMAQGQIELPPPVWRRLNYSWVVFFALSGMLNLYVARNYPEDIWVRFNLLGGIAIMLLFLVGQGLYLMRYMDRPDKSD